MGLVNQFSGTSSESIKSPFQVCHTCKAKKDGIFTVDPNGRPQCIDCMPEKDRLVMKGERT